MIADFRKEIVKEFLSILVELASFYVIIRTASNDIDKRKKGERNMFDNIGGKIKTLAEVVCALGIIASVLAAFVVWG